MVLALAATSASAEALRSKEYASVTTPGIDYIYCLEYDSAIQFFTELGQRYPEHPGPPLSRSVAIWLRELFARQELDLDNFLSPGYFGRPAGEGMPEEDQKAYLEGLAKSRELAEKYLEKYPGNLDGRYYLGAVEGARGTFALTIERSYMKALKHGKKAYEYQKAIIDEDPNFDDSYMTVGTFEYVLGNLPWYVKWIATIAGYRGSEERGFQYLIRAAEKGLFVYNEARVLLMILYMREKEYAYALQVVSQLHNRYPQNFLLHLNQAQILERMGEQGQAVGTYMAVIRNAEEGMRGYRMLPLGTFRYGLGRKLMSLGYPELALELFQEATRDPLTPSREKALSYLRAGEILDLKGKREDAVSHYQEVQQLEDFDNSHRAAGKYIKKPFNQ